MYGYRHLTKKRQKDEEFDEFQRLFSVEITIEKERKKGKS